MKPPRPVRTIISVITSSVQKRRWIWKCLVGLMAITAAVVFVPVPVGGCYWEIGDYSNGTAGDSFSYLADGHAYFCNEYSARAVEWGAYQYEEGVGWVLSLRKYERRIRIRPRLLFMTLEAIDGIDRPASAPFLWRYPFIWKASATLRKVSFERASGVGNASSTPR